MDWGGHDPATPLALKLLYKAGIPFGVGSLWFGYDAVRDVLTTPRTRGPVRDGAAGSPAPPWRGSRGPVAWSAVVSTRVAMCGIFVMRG